MDGTTEVSRPKIDRLHRLVTSGVGAGYVGIDDLRCHLTLLATLPVEGVHLVQFLNGRSL